MRNPRGFTLIELMLVMAIIGLIATAVMFTLPTTTNSQTTPQNLTVTLQQQLQFAREYAMVQQRPVGLHFADRRYHFYQYREQQWQPLQKRGFKPGYLTDGLEWQLEPLAGNLVQQQEQTSAQDLWANDEADESQQQDEEQAPVPQLMILPSGEMTAFQLHVYDPVAPASERWLFTQGAWNISVEEQPSDAR